MTTGVTSRWPRAGWLLECYTPGMSRPTDRAKFRRPLFHHRLAGTKFIHEQLRCPLPIISPFLLCLTQRPDSRQAASRSRSFRLSSQPHHRERLVGLCKNCRCAQATPNLYLFAATQPAFPVLFSSFFLHVDNTSENHFYSIRPSLCSLKEPQIPPGLMNDILGALQ